MKIFLIAGKAGSGKSEVADIIKNYYEEENKKVVVTEYSKYLKLYAKEILAWNGEEPKPRSFLQDLGVTIRENMDDPLFLIRRMIEDIRIYDLYSDIVIISDVRLKKEISKML